MYDLVSLGRSARAAARSLRTTGNSERGAALYAIARALRDNRARILEANRTDVELARCAGLRSFALTRLTLTAARIEALAARVEAVSGGSDPLGAVSGSMRLSGGGEICSVRVPIGVIGLISDGAPATIVDAVALCVRTGNVCVISGGKSAYGTTRVLGEIMRGAVAEAGLTSDAVLTVEDASEETTRRLLSFNEGLDLIIPCGDEEFLMKVREQARVPILDTSGGCCCFYVDQSADMDRAVRILDDARTSAPADPISTDTVLVHSSIAEEFLPRLADALDLHAVEIRGCPRTREILPNVRAAQETDWGMDYRNLVLNVRIVDSLEEAVEFIECYSDHVADGVLARDITAVRRFTALADSAAVCVNASPRRLSAAPDDPGISVGFSRGRLHIRGPIGLRAFTTEKTILLGSAM